MGTEKRCPDCGNPLGSDAMSGLCPVCLMNVGAGASIEFDATRTVIGNPIRTEHLPIGSELGQYRIQRVLGHGGMGVVYEAEEMESGRRVALKVIQQKLNSRRDRSRFLREGRLAASINHPNCVYVFGTDEIEDTPIIAMEYVTGGTLEQRLLREDKLPIPETVDAVLDVIAGLEAAQTMGILHRDIKPSNCFEDENGNIKIGDFGLSMSTEARTQSLITEAGSMLGTPSYCSPEQLRGEELSWHTDQYAVGVMLYQLLTGKLPFEGKTMAQLIANTLEKRPSPPHTIRPEIPNSLSRIILRCLSKQASDRYHSYAELRRALIPYSSTAPTPVTLGLRFLAGLIDSFFLNLCTQAILYLCFDGPLAAFSMMTENQQGMWCIVIPTFILMILYFAIMESRWGASVGKLFCRIRVVRPDGSYPSFRRTAIRASVYQLFPVLPLWIIAFFSHQAVFGPSKLNNVLGFVYFALIAMLFITARRRNDYAGIHDLLSDTQIIGHTAVATRQALQQTVTIPDIEEKGDPIGPYHIIRNLGETEDAEWIEAYDFRLLRRVMIRQVSPGTPPWPKNRCHIQRIGRLRWLTGRRTETENWDAFEGVGGSNLTDLVTSPQSWEQVRFWLYDLATEFKAAEKDNSLPDSLTLDRVWITNQGRAKLLDIPGPALKKKESINTQPITSEASPSQTINFLQTIASTALQSTQKNIKHKLPFNTHLPIHARNFLIELTNQTDISNVAQTVRPLLYRTAKVTRLRRLILTATCIALPLFMGIAFLVGIASVRKLAETQPQLLELSQLYRIQQSSKNRYPDEAFSIYIAHHYHDFITQEKNWSTPLAHTLFAPEAKTYALKAVEEFASATPEQLTQAEEKLAPLLKHKDINFFNLSKGLRFIYIFMVMIMIVYVGIPAILAALFFRGGLLLLATGITFVRGDGRPASRLRLVWRALMTWSPLLIPILSIFSIYKTNDLMAIITTTLLLFLVTLLSLLLPKRGLPDYLSGTWPVPR